MRFKYQDHFVDGNGRVIKDGTVTVYLAGTSTPATIYADETTVTPITGSVVTTATDGLFGFWIDMVSGQKFKLVLSKANYVTQTYDDVAIGGGRECEFYYIGDFANSLATMVSRVGSDRVTVVVNVPITNSDTITTDPNTTLMFTAGGSITNTGTLTIGAPIEAGFYQIFSGAGTYQIKGEIKVDWFGTTSAAINQAFGAVVIVNPDEVAANTERPNTPTKVTFTPGREYVISGEITADAGRNMQIDFAGAYFSGTYDGVWFNIQGDNQYDPPTWKVGPSENLLINGPAYMINSGANTASVAFKLYGCTNTSVCHFKIEDFFKGIELGKSENFKIYSNQFVGVQYGVHMPPFVDTVGEDDDEGEDVLIWYTQNLRIYHNQFNPPSTGGVYAISIDRQVKGLRIWENGFGRLWDNVIYLANVADLNGDFEAIEIRGNHFENIKCPILYLKNYNAVAPFRGVSVENNNITVWPPSDYSGYEVFHIENTEGIRFDKNKYNFWANAGGYTIYSFDADCSKITVGNGESYKNRTPGTTTLTYFSYACDRDEITWLPETRHVWQNLTGYFQVEKSTGNETLDLDALLGSDYPHLLPKAVFIHLKAQDSASSTATSCYVAVRKDSGTSILESVHVQLEGVKNNSGIHAQGWIPVNTDGTIYLQVVATGTDTITLTVAVKLFLM